MQLLSMEVNQLGSADRIQVGALSRGLNAICGRRGSGKSSVLRWLRGMIHPAPVRAHDAARQVEHASGRLSLQINGLEYQLERYERAGKTVSKILRPSAFPWHTSPSSSNGSSPSGHSHSPETISQLQRDAFDLLAAVPSDGRATDRLWQCAAELNLDQVTQPRYAEVRSQLTSRELELVHQLEPFERETVTREALLERRQQLDADLQRVRRDSAARRYTPDTDEHRRLSDRLATIDADARKLSDEIEEVDAQLLRMREGGYVSAESVFQTPQSASFKERLVAIDAQLARWRNTLSEVRSHRERLEACATDAQLDGQLGEQLTPINQATPRLALRALEAQIIEARRHFDVLLEGVDRYRAEHDDARNQLPQTLRLMQRELHEVCQQLSRHESLTANRAMKDQISQLARCESEMRQSIERLIAERGELMRSIASACQLSVDQVAVAYSDSCRCADHPQLDSWLTAISSGTPGHVQAHHPSAYLHRHDEMTRLEARRAQAVSRLEDCQREYREIDARLRRFGDLPLNTAPLDGSEDLLLRDLSEVSEQLLRLEQRDRLRVELSEVRRRLQQLPREVEDANSLRGRYERHLSGLTGQSRSSKWSYTGDPAFQVNHHLHGHAADTLHDPVTALGHHDARLGNGHVAGHYRRFEAGHSGAPHFAAPRSHNSQYPDAGFDSQLRRGRLEEVALRLAIIDILAARGHAIPLVLDQTLDGLDAPQTLTAVRYLAHAAESAHLQVVALTDDQGLIEAVKTVRGNVVPLVVSRALQSQPPAYESDVNRQLLAYANDAEADKWCEPAPTVNVPPRSEPKGRSPLTERSDIEQIPSVNARAAARLRALGIDTVGDLLEADYAWLVENARLDGIPSEAIDTWQSEARILCAMPQLRPFDARVLVGAGVRDHRQLAEMHPSDLLECVENFLATDRGRRIMRSGSTYELSRITAWIASAKRGSAARPNSSHRISEHADIAPRGRRSDTQRSRDRHEPVPTYQIVERDDEAPADDNVSAKRSERRRLRRQRTERNRPNARPAAAENSNDAESESTDLRFHLDPCNPVVDAPSIGPNLAQRLAKLNISTVEQLLAANPDDVARDLDQPRITGSVVRAWQEQARLVCRIPNLRGHDAQILVACGITAPEALSRMEPVALLKKATAFVNSTQGQRVLRGSEAPDLDEIKDWIRWAGQSRTLMAA